MKLKSILAVSLMLLLPLTLIAAPLKPIPVDEAFQFSAQVSNPNTLSVTWEIAPTYHLYKDRFKFHLVSPQNASIADSRMPPSETLEDQLLGAYEVYNNTVSIPIPVIMPTPGDITLDIEYQGCADSGYCYPPTTKRITLNTLIIGSQTKGSDVASASDNKAAVTKESTGYQSEQSKITQLLRTQSIWLILLVFLGFGLLLTFTPCVLPMVPILSSIIIGHGKDITTAKAFTLSLTYVLAMASTYALIGILAGLLGSQLQAAFQNPWVLGVFSFLFVLLALSLFGFFEIRLPRKLESTLTVISGHQRGGSYLGVFVMGFLATLIVSPCVTPPLVGALAYIGQTGNASLGGLALFTMGIGMGIPLILLGTFGVKMLPKSGTWLNAIKSVLGVLMLGVALWLLARVIPGQISLLLWGILLTISAIYMGALEPSGPNGWKKLSKGLGIIFAIYGILLIIGASLGGSNPLAPLSPLTNNSVISTNITHEQGPKRIKSIADLNQALSIAKQQQKPVVIDFYADWCITCQVMEKKVFADPNVKQALQSFVFLQADVTANDATDKELQKYLNVFAPPSVLFFNTKGKEVEAERIVGSVDTEEFIQHLERVKS